ncbi:hypothetical protein [Arthrobacter sp. H35-D1]|uniref:hypothetical protein n=1 Tax=Arthrobacter sp. H35-D1 TaxID=3046202 RepID=UPI0024B9A2A7|nr:hypothetical protein [Arthrobacter sp. H35-D1]MDJ0312716.1 hypothetical protein [Arthrobacter sp. H35-D1]
MADVLEFLIPPPELYDYRRDEEDGVPFWLPYAQGDVFENITMPGFPDDDAGLAMLFMHPCTMREGAVLREFVTAIKVDVFSSKKVVSAPEKWANRNKLMPLPDLFGGGHSTHIADFMKISTIPSASLNRSSRVCQLSIEGRLQMQQRLIFHLSRYAPSVDVLRTATAALDLEMQAQTDWMEAASLAGALRGASSVIEQEANFDAFMGASIMESRALSETANRPPSRRELLRSPHDAPSVVRDVQRQIQQLFS